MDFEYTKEQKMYKEAAREFLKKECPFEVVREIIRSEKGYAPSLWKKIADLDWLRILIEERYGGAEGNFLDVCPILEEIGRAIFPSPFFPTVLMSAPLLSDEASEELKESILPPLGNGNAIISLGVGEIEGWWKENGIKMQAEKHGDEFVLNGTMLFVPFAAASDHMICHAIDNAVDGRGTSLFLVDRRSDGVECTAIPSFSIERYYRANFRNVKVKEENIISERGRGSTALEGLWPKTVAGKCIEIIGGLQKVLELTVDYLKKREQFGAPIGSFQALQFYCADMAIDVQASKFIAYQAAWKVDKNLTSKNETSMAKAWCGDAYRRVTALAQQAHGAIGFTEEYDLHFFYKHAKSLQLMYGGSPYHRRIVAEEMGL